MIDVAGGYDVVVSLSVGGVAAADYSLSHTGPFTLQPGISRFTITFTPSTVCSMTINIAQLDR
jgi:hypothetical protein